MYQRAESAKDGARVIAAHDSGVALHHDSVAAGGGCLLSHDPRAGMAGCSTLPVAQSAKLDHHALRNSESRCYLVEVYWGQKGPGHWPGVCGSADALCWQASLRIRKYTCRFSPCTFRRCFRYRVCCEHCLTKKPRIYAEPPVSFGGPQRPDKPATLLGALVCHSAVQIGCPLQGLYSLRPIEARI